MTLAAALPNHPFSELKPLMDEQDERLRQLITTVCQHPDGSQEWRRSMSRLLIVVQGLPEFRKYSRPDCPDYLLDSLNRTWEWLSRNIKNFEPRTSSIREDLVKWIKGYLYWRIRDLAVPNSLAEYSLDEITKDSEGVENTTKLEQLSNLTLSGLEAHIEQLQRQSQQRLVLKLEHYIEQDPNRKLRNCYPRKHPECNCQLLSQRLLSIFKDPPDKLADLAEEFNINYQTLTSHWKRKGIPLLQKIANELGYQHN